MAEESKQKCILVIDDDAGVRDIICQFLKDLPVSLVQAANGDQGLKTLKTTAVDLVITDIMMPQKDGIEMIIEIRKDFPAMPVIAISGGGQAKNFDFLEFAGKVGAVERLVKPFRRDDLLAAVGRVLPN